MDQLLSMRVFQQVVDEGGFAAAARKLDLAPAVVTRLVGDLEKRLGVRLLQRTTRSLSLTPAGQGYLARLRVILSDIEEADGAATAHAREMSGTLRLLTSPALATHVVSPAIAEFQRRHPQVVLDIHVEDVADPEVDDHDLSILLGTVRLHSTAIVRTLLTAHSIFCASPTYLDRHGEPLVPEDLREHRCLRLRVPGVRLRSMTLTDPTQENREVTVDVPAVVTANHSDTLLQVTLDGGGIGSHAGSLAASLIRGGQLRRVLAPWITSHLSVVAVLPSRQFIPARTRAFMDFMAEYARTTLAGPGVLAVNEPWDRASGVAPEPGRLGASGDSPQH